MFVPAALKCVVANGFAIVALSAGLTLSPAQAATSGHLRGPFAYESRVRELLTFAPPRSWKSGAGGRCVSRSAGLRAAGHGQTSDPCRRSAAWRVVRNRTVSSTARRADRLRIAPGCDIRASLIIANELFQRMRKHAL